MAECIETGHRLLTEIAALRERDRPRRPIDFLRQGLVGDIDRKRIAAHDPHALHVSRIRPREVFGLEPPLEWAFVRRGHLNEEAVGPAPVHAGETHIDAPEPGADVIEES